ncbi:hypothetical protein PCANC_09712 [Puccinia coronata f. sp. avenae]|uniref:Uncharacterized protein n=1 Tax=Puccinia coronata f. sp. avenae TaxID=200324 RepID=A0A2N5V7F7_9BASI|nr:hypothetical protein PCANC_09712 [Puccinia coronata f. sp. avenae]
MTIDRRRPRRFYPIHTAIQQQFGPVDESTEPPSTASLQLRCSNAPTLVASIHLFLVPTHVSRGSEEEFSAELNSCTGYNPLRMAGTTAKVLISRQVATAKFLLARQVASYFLAEEGLLTDSYLSAKEGNLTGSYLPVEEDIVRQVATAEVLIAR